MSTDHRVHTDEVDESTSSRVSPTAEFILIMVITGVTALGGVTFLTF